MINCCAVIYLWGTDLDPNTKHKRCAPLRAPLQQSFVLQLDVMSHSALTSLLDSFHPIRVCMCAHGKGHRRINAVGGKAEERVRYGKLI